MENNMAEETQQVNEPGLTINDIVNCLQIIDIAVSRGAIQGSEASQVGAVRDKVAAYCDFHAKPAEPVEAPVPPETESVDTAETTVVDVEEED